jgi:hypothetical protein
MLSAFMAFIEPGDEVIIFEPFFDQSVSGPRYIWVVFTLTTGVGILAISRCLGGPSDTFLYIRPKTGRPGRLQLQNGL